MGAENDYLYNKFAGSGVERPARKPSLHSRLQNGEFGNWVGEIEGMITDSDLSVLSVKNSSNSQIHS